MSLGEAAPNILKEPDLVYGVSFVLSEDWTTLTATLGFSDVKQTYMMWLWLNTAWDLTFERIQDGGNVQTGVIGTLGATAFEDTISYMRLELPLMTLATQMQIYLGAAPNCTSFYMTNMKLSNETSQLLCADPTFGFSDVF